jgi:hypothetical protein
LKTGECLHPQTTGYTVPATNSSDGSMPVKKGRHRRFEEARALKRTSDDLDAILDKKDAEPCPECGATPGHDHASWCLFEENAEGEAWPR